MRRALTLAWRLHRAELAAVTVAALAVAVAWLAAAADLAETHRRCQSIGPTVAPCGGIQLGTYYTDVSQSLIPMVSPLAGALPFLAGLVVGVAATSRELEHRTAHLAWTLSGSRLRWLKQRLVPVGILAVLALVPASLAGEVMVANLYPLTDPGANFEHYGVRGPLLLARLVPALLLGAGVGLLVGRQLPALLLAGALVVGMGIGLSVLRPFGAEPMERPLGERPDDRVGDMYVGIVYRDAEGNRIPDEQAWELLGGSEEELDREHLPRELGLVILSERYPEVLVREGVVLGLLALGLGGAAMAVARRRRPA